MRKYRAHIYRGEVLVGGNSSRRLPATWQGRYKKGSGKWKVASGRRKEKGERTKYTGPRRRANAFAQVAPLSSFACWPCQDVCLCCHLGLSVPA